MIRTFPCIHISHVSNILPERVHPTFLLTIKQKKQQIAKLFPLLLSTKMHFSLQLISAIIILTFTPVCIQNTCANQESSASQEQRKERIALLLENNKYRQALLLLDAELESNPHTLYYHYTKGRCLLALDTLHAHAVYHLKRAISPAYTPDVYYYLGKAYYHHYQFNEALQALSQYKDQASWRSLRDSDHNQYIQGSRQALKELQELVVYEVLRKHNIPYYELTDLYNTLRNESLITLEKSNTQTGYLYYVKPSRQHGQDLYRMENSSDSYTEGQSLGSLINTEEDESYPYFDTPRQTLWFSSKGHASMGGYDIQQSQAQEDQAWSPPVSPGFPINSPYNDYFLIPKDDAIFVLATDRTRIKDSVTIFTLRKTALRTDYSEANAESIRQASVFQFQEVLQQEPIIQLKESIEKAQWASEDSLIEKALHNQLVIDSLFRISYEKEEALYQSFNTNEKKRLRHEIAQLNRLAKQLEKSNLLLYERIPSLSDNKPPPGQPGQTPSNEFEIRAASAYSQKHPFPVDPPLPEGIIYKIQLGALSNQVAYDRFQGIYPITVERIDNESISRYYAGIFQSYDACAEALKTIKRMGHSDAYIVSFLDGERITLQRAREIEIYTNRQ